MPATPIKAGKVSPMLEVPPHITRPPYAASGRMPEWDDRPQARLCAERLASLCHHSPADPTCRHMCIVAE